MEYPPEIFTPSSSAMLRPASLGRARSLLDAYIRSVDLAPPLSRPSSSAGDDEGFGSFDAAVGVWNEGDGDDDLADEHDGDEFVPLAAETVEQLKKVRDSLSSRKRGRAEAGGGGRAERIISPVDDGGAASFEERERGGADDVAIPDSRDVNKEERRSLKKLKKSEKEEKKQKKEEEKFIKLEKKKKKAEEKQKKEDEKQKKEEEKVKKRIDKELRKSAKKKRKSIENRDL